MLTPPKSPFGYDLLVYVWVIFLSVLGGIVNFTRKMREGKVRVFNITEFIGELVTSAFSGLCTFWLCEWANLDQLLMVVFVAISGHMGSRAIMLFERWAEDKFQKLGGVNDAHHG